MAAIAACTLILAGAAAPASAKKPRPGTYSGAGSMVGDPSYGMELAFGFDGANASFHLVGFTQPACNGYMSVPPAGVAKRRFKLTASNSDRTIVLKGRWSEPKELSGRMIMTVDPAAVCGTPGTYEYRFGARRYGGQ
jgi:hypothetical protein